MRQIRFLLVAFLIASACQSAAPPTISGFTPGSGPVGSIITVSGINLGQVRSAAFDGVSATIVAVSEERVVLKVPAGATTGQITVRSDAGAAASARHFNVTPGTSTSDAQVPDPNPSPAILSTSTGYSFLSVPTSRGTFAVHLIKERLSDVRLKTVTGSLERCREDCPVKPLADYVSEHRAYAGMNGTYFCPPDYAECAGKVNSFDYAVYSTDLGEWINLPALVTQNGLVTFDASGPKFYRRSYVYAQDRVLSRAPITAGLTMYPLLLLNGTVVESEPEQSAAQKQRSAKGSIGVDADHIYLALVANATVTEAAHALQAIGVRNALNLDGGGTSAMWIGGGYKVGPGRLLPNAIVLTKP